MGAGDGLIPLDHAHRKAGQIEIALAIGVGHLGGLAAQQGAIRHAAAGGDPLDQLGHQRRLQRVQRHVIEEEQRLGPEHEHVVDAHRHQVDADRVELPGLGRQLHLAADAVGAGDQHRVLVVLLEQLLVVVETKQSGKTARQRDHSRPVRAGQAGLDPLDHLVVGVDIHARLLVAHVFTHG